MVVNNPLKLPDFLRGMVLRGVPLDSQYPCLLIFFIGLPMLNIHIRFNHWLVGGSSLWFDYCNTALIPPWRIPGRLSEQTEYNNQNITIFFANEPEILWLTPHLSVNLSSTQWSFGNKTHTLQGTSSYPTWGKGKSSTQKSSVWGYVSFQEGIFFGEAQVGIPQFTSYEWHQHPSQIWTRPMRLANVRHRDASKGPCQSAGKTPCNQDSQVDECFCSPTISWKKSIGKQSDSDDLWF